MVDFVRTSLIHLGLYQIIDPDLLLQQVKICRNCEITLPGYSLRLHKEANSTLTINGKYKLYYMRQIQMKSVTWNSCAGNFQGSYKYNMILGCNILSKLNIYLCLSNNTSTVNMGAYKGCTEPTKAFKNQFQLVIQMA